MRIYDSTEIATISTAFVEVYSGLCFTSPWLCADDGDPASQARLEGYWGLDATPRQYPASGILKKMTSNGRNSHQTDFRKVQTLQELIQEDDEQDLKRNWLYEFYRRAWNNTNQMFEVKQIDLGGI